MHSWVDILPPALMQIQYRSKEHKEPVLGPNNIERLRTEYTFDATRPTVKMIPWLAQRVQIVEVLAALIWLKSNMCYKSLPRFRNEQKGQTEMKQEKTVTTMHS